MSEPDGTNVQPEYPPGSDKAIAAGCTCPVLDNVHGHGWVVNGKRVWWIHMDCPLHGQQPLTLDDLPVVDSTEAKP